MISAFVFQIEVFLPMLKLPACKTYDEAERGRKHLRMGGAALYR
jgi:hypothetical protein